MGPTVSVEANKRQRIADGVLEEDEGRQLNECGGNNWVGRGVARVARRMIKPPAPTLTPYLVTVPVVYHVGTLDPAKKKLGSLEGKGLSVSECPEEWRTIARLGDAATWKLSRSEGYFVDAIAALADEKLREFIIDWAVEHSYVRWGHRWELEARADDDQVLFIRYPTRREALAAREPLEWGSTQLQPVAKRRLMLAKTRMTQRALQHSAANSSVLDLALSFYVEDHLPEIDGLWWYEELAPAAYSAPRGVIFANRLTRWQQIELDSGP